MLNEPDWLLGRRLEALKIYQSLPMPTTSDEPWRRTDIRPLRLDAIGPHLNGNGVQPGGPDLISAAGMGRDKVSPARSFK